MKAALRLFLIVSVLAFLGVFARPIWLLTATWLSDPGIPPRPPQPGMDDASRLNANSPIEVIPVASNVAAAEAQLVELIHRAAREHRQIAISGAHHSMGGHSLNPGQLVVDMLPFRALQLDPEQRVLTAGAGALWSDIIPYLDHRGLSVAVMQSNNDFSVGGSISVNCHGWQNDSPPIASTVVSLRLLTADGSIRTCSRSENTELFDLVLGGYGLFGIILDVKLHVVPNEYYKAEAHDISPRDYNRIYHELTANGANIGMAYGRIDVAPSSFLEHAIITVLRRQQTELLPIDTLKVETASKLKRVVFRAGAGSDFGKNLRWRLETLFGETGGELLARNQIMNEPANLYANRDPKFTDILHEYFIPVARLSDFLDQARAIFIKFKPDLLNITVRNVEPDRDAFLAYAREEVFGLVMLFNQARDPAADRAMQQLTQALVDAALRCGGTYYLPYRLHPTIEQFNSAYPQAHEFFTRKRKYDPEGLFQNEFSLRFGERSRTD